MNTVIKTFGFIAIACVIIGTGLFAGCQKSGGPENPLSGRNLVVYGEIFTADPSESIVEAFVVKDGKFVYVGSKAGLLKDNGEKLMDVRGGDILTLGETVKPTGYVTDEVIPYVVNKAVGALLDDAQYRQACINKDIFNTKVASTWFEGKQVYPNN